MIFTPTPLPSAFVIDLEKHQDERGFFARSWCADEFSRLGLNPRLAQCNISYNKKKGTLRGMHYQAAPFEEAKLVRCTRGSLFDVIIDLRPESPTYKQHFSQVLSRDNHVMLYVPEGLPTDFKLWKMKLKSSTRCRSRSSLPMDVGCVSMILNSASSGRLLI